MKRRIDSTLLVVSIFLRANAGRCDPPRPRVHVAIDGCADAENAEIRRILGIELRAELGDVASGAPSDTTDVQVTCAASTTELRVVDPITGKSLVRTIDLARSAPRARARLIALAASELVSASWTEMELSPQPVVAPAGVPASAEAVRAARDVVVSRTPALAPRSFRILAVLTGIVRTEAGGPLLGGGARVGVGDPDHPFGFAMDLVAMHASDAVSLGSVSIDTVSLAPAVLYHLKLAPSSTVFIGAGVRAGLARLVGEPADPGAATGGTRAGPWLGPRLEVGVGMNFGRHLRCEVVTEIGDALVPVTGKVMGADVGILGPWLGLTLGIGFVP